MKRRPARIVERGRIRDGVYGTRTADGCTGAYQVGPLRMICGDGLGWEHVSVSREDRCPSWHEMVQVKGWFWEPEETVMQLHPPESTYVNQHPHCLHLWRPIGREIPLPNPIMVGYR